LNFLQLAQAVKRESGLSGGGPISVVTAKGDDARIFQWVNWAHRDICLLHESWLFRRGSAIGQTTVMAMPHDLASPGFGLSDFANWKPQSIDYKVSAWRVSDGQQAEQPIAFLPWDDFRSRYVVGTHQPGGIQHWSITPSGEMQVGPTPDSAFSVRADYIKDVVDMTLDSHVPMIPARFHNLIVWRALLEYGGFDSASDVYQRAERNHSTGMPALLQAQLPQRWIAARGLA
jgi:hypothetical protein